jgi:hypothetical protein
MSPNDQNWVFFFFFKIKNYYFFWINRGIFIILTKFYDFFFCLSTELGAHWQFFCSLKDIITIRSFRKWDIVNWTVVWGEHVDFFLKSLVKRLIYSLSLLSGIILHDPVSFVALVRPDLFTYKKGVVRVETQGICVGHTLMDREFNKYVQTS